MIRLTLSNEIMKRIMAIEQNKFCLKAVALPPITANRLRKNSKKKSSYASTQIEGNPLSEEQVNRVLEEDAHRHFLKPEQEVRNYFLALTFLDEQVRKKTLFSTDLILKVQSFVEKGASKEKIGLRGSMPPGVLFAVYDAQTGAADYIPPEAGDVPALLDELVDYVNTTDDHPLIIAAVVHYQLATIHPFEDGNGRTARLMSGYILDLLGYGFSGIGSLDEYFAYDVDEYYRSLQMGLPALYYDGRANPPNPEIWFNYFLRMVELYSRKVCDLSKAESQEDLTAGLSHLNKKEREFLAVLTKKKIIEFAPIEMVKTFKVSNRTIINWCAKLVQCGFLAPILVKERIRSYKLISPMNLERKK